MLEIDGARYSGSGTIVRQAVAYAALTGQPIRIVNARINRPNAGLRPQHIRVVEAIGELVGASIEGLQRGSQELTFRPGPIGITRQSYRWDIGSAGSTTLLAHALLPILARARQPVEVELRGGLFQDHAPSFYHLAHVMIPLIRRLGFGAEATMERPGYVPSGGGILTLKVEPQRDCSEGLVLEEGGRVERVWGIALASHLEQRRVSHRMASAAQGALGLAGHQSSYELAYDTTALQAGAGLALFADRAGGVRLGADRAGAPKRRAETIGAYAARLLLEEIDSGATLDRHAADQVIPFAALVGGESRFRIGRASGHVESAAWLAMEFVGADVRTEGNMLVVRGAGLRP